MINSKKTVRESGVELLRILAAMGVIVSHYCNYNSAFASTHLSGWGGINYNLLLLLQCLTVCSVDVFVLISGYFSSKIDKRVVGKPLDLLIQSVLFVVLFYVGKVITSDEPFSYGEFFVRFIPANYFIILYVTLYLISPYINMVLRRLSVSQKKIRCFVVVLLLVFSVFPMITNITEYIVGYQLIGFSPISRLGDQSGYNIVNFCLLYCIGASIRYLELDKTINKRVAGVVAVGCVIIIYLMYIFAIRPEMGHVAWKYHNLFVILLSASLFVLFKQMKFKVGIINTLAKAAFVCFLIHGKFFPYLRVEYFVHQPFYIMLAHLFVSLIGIYIISWVVWYVYTLISTPVFKRLNNVSIPILTDEDNES